MTFAILGGIGAALAEAVPEIVGGVAAAGEGATAAATAAAPELATTGSFIGDAAAMGLGGTAETAVPVGSTLSSLASGVGGGAAGSSGLASLAGIGGSSGALGSLGSLAGQQLAGQAIGQGIQGIQSAEATAQNQQAGKQAFLANSAEQQAQQRQAGALGTKVFGHATGGEVNLHNGDWIVPADVLSNIGNGSTDAGARFLNDFFGIHNDGQRSPT